MEYSRKVAMTTLALAFAMAAAVQLQVTAARNAPADYVALHNAARAAVGVGPVAWNATVAAYAQSYAEQRRGDCKLEHSSGGPYGENLFGGRGGGAGWTAVDAVASWVSEWLYYNHANNTCAAGKVCEHYTQVVWNTTTAIGCGRAVCDGDNDGVVIVCSYSPPGNVVGQSPY